MPENLRLENLLYFYNTHRYCMMIYRWVVKEADEPDCTMCRHDQPICHIAGGENDSQSNIDLQG